MGNFLQFQLWRDCKNNCEFCWQKDMPDVNKHKMVDNVIDILNSRESDEYDEYGFIGGEFFQNQMKDSHLKSKFLKLFDICHDKFQEGKLKKIYLATSLIFKKSDVFIETLEKIKNLGLDNIVLICTSYDTKYRFHNLNSRMFWEQNMKFLSEKYPSIKVHTEIILSYDFITKVLSNEFNIADFESRFNTRIDYISPQCNLTCSTKEEIDNIIPGFILRRKDFLKFLVKVHSERTIDLPNLLNKNFHSSTFYTDINGELTKIINRRTDWENIGIEGNKKFNRKFYELNYIDSDKTLEQDIQLFLNHCGDL